MQTPPRTTVLPPDFSLAPGGPVDRLLARFLRVPHPDNVRVGRIALGIALFAWLPLCVAAVIAHDPTVDITFFQDIATHARFLLTLPLLIFAEAAVGARTRLVVAQFLASGLVGDSDAQRFEAATTRAVRLRDSVIAELMVAVLAAFSISFALRDLLSDPVQFWFERATAGGMELSLAGWWYGAVATPIVLFMVLRWAWRYCVWAWFLGRIAKLDLRLAATHPDRMGGLGFVSFNQGVFAGITLAVACTIAGAAGCRVLYAGVALKSYQPTIIGFALAAVIVGVAPLLVFSKHLVLTKRRAWLTYGRLATDYVHLFERKWFGKAGSDETILGSGDVQSLADMGGSFDRMSRMLPFAVDRRLLISFLAAALGPMLPLLLTVMPLKEIVRVLVKAVV